MLVSTLPRSLCAVALILAAGAMCGAASPAADISPSDPQAAQKVLAEWYAAFTESEIVTGEFDAKIDATGKGQSPKSDITAYRLVVQRPNKLLVAATRGPGLAVV